MPISSVDQNMIQRIADDVFDGKISTEKDLHRELKSSLSGYQTIEQLRLIVKEVALVKYGENELRLVDSTAMRYLIK